MTSGDPAQIITAFAPIAEECIRLRKENHDLRWQQTVNLEIANLFDDTPISIERGRRGHWRYSIKCCDTTTGGESFDSYEKAVKAALQRVGQLFLYGPDEDEAES